VLSVSITPQSCESVFRVDVSAFLFGCVIFTVLYFFFGFFCLKQQVYLPAFTPHNNGLVYQITYINTVSMHIYVRIKCRLGVIQEVLLNMQCSDTAHNRPYLRAKSDDIYIQYACIYVRAVPASTMC
jgi:hypothetical protein